MSTACFFSLKKKVLSCGLTIVKIAHMTSVDLSFAVFKCIFICMFLPNKYLAIQRGRNGQGKGREEGKGHRG